MSNAASRTVGTSPFYFLVHINIIEIVTRLEIQSCLMSSKPIIWEPLLSNGNAVLMFYDGGCSACAREVGHYINLKNNHNLKSVIFHDIDSQGLGDLSKVNNGIITKTDAMKKLHVLDMDNKLHVGIDAFLPIWRELPYWKHLAVMATAVPGVLPSARIAYNIFAAKRYNYRMASVKLDGSSCIVDLETGENRGRKR